MATALHTLCRSCSNYY